MKLIFSILCSLLLTSCPNKSMSDTQESNEIVSLFEGSLLGSGKEGFQKENLIISSEKQWQEFLNKIDSVNKVSSGFKSEIDFKSSIVLVTIDSVRNSGGFGVKMIALKDENEKLDVIVNYTGPKPTDMVTMAITQPINIVKIKKTNKEIIFVER
ncbi:PrcB_C domain-containing protein [Tenacibaculum sp. 190130A14a]|uniref:PrcB_C domain-containing protein n=1 Tax=Tenacibaculum polynesiense TaxID=3137857 RepID=A0ABP1F4Q0_9FLAO